MATPASTARADGNRYWDIFTADDGGRLVRLCWEKNDAGNFMAMEVAELVTWNNATEQKEAEDFLLMALNAVEKDRNWLLKRAEGEDKTFLAALGIQVLLATVNKEALKQLAIARGTSMAKVVNDWLQELRGQGST